MNKYPRFLILLTAVLVFASCNKEKNTPDPVVPPPSVKTFLNPLLNGSDPWVTQKNGFYYYSQTVGDRVALWRTTAMSKLGQVSSTQVYKPAAGSANSSNLWAPEMHFLDNKWYVYYTAGSGPDATQRTWVLENSNADPMAGPWTDKGRVFSTDADFWAIDGTVLENNGHKYFIWSGRPNLAVQNQNIYIAKMSNPWTLEPPTINLTSPTLAWEVNGGPVNEGPEILKSPAGKIFLVYSASGCWTDDYALGLLSLKANGDPMVMADWTKRQEPVFTKKAANHAYGPGHNAFFKSPDGTEDWIIYHANSNSGEGCGEKRNIRMQKFAWNTDGTPNFGEPVATGAPTPVPAGE